MDDAGFLELPTGLIMVELYCQTLDSVAELEAHVRRLGADHIVRGGIGDEPPTTIGRCLEAQRAEVLAFAAELGLTPRSRREITAARRWEPLDPQETERRKALAAALLDVTRTIRAAADAEPERP